MKIKKILLFIYLLVICFFFLNFNLFKISARVADDETDIYEEITCNDKIDENIYSDYTNDYRNVENYINGVKSYFDLNISEEIKELSGDFTCTYTTETYSFYRNDNIIDVIPEICFKTEGVHTAIGDEYGFYVNTEKFNDDFNKSIVLIFKTQMGEINKDKKSIDFSFQISFCTEYLYSLTGVQYRESNNAHIIELKLLNATRVIPFKTYKYGNQYTDFYETLHPISIKIIDIETEIINLEPSESGKTVLSKGKVSFNDIDYDKSMGTGTNIMKISSTYVGPNYILKASSYEQDNNDKFKFNLYYENYLKIYNGALSNTNLYLTFCDESTLAEHKASRNVKRLIYDVKNRLNISQFVSEFPMYEQNTSDKYESFMKFKVYKTGFYSIQTLGELGTSLKLYNDMFSELKTIKSGGEGNNAYIEHYLETNVTYYLSLKSKDGNSGKTKILILGDHKSITSNSQKQITLKGSIWQVYEFTSKSTAKYTIQTYGSIDTYMYLLDIKGNVLKYDDDGGSNGNSKITYTLTKNKKYYICVRSYYNSDTGASTIKLYKG